MLGHGVVVCGMSRVQLDFSRDGTPGVFTCVLAHAFGGVVFTHPSRQAGALAAASQHIQQTLINKFSK